MRPIICKHCKCYANFAGSPPRRTCQRESDPLSMVPHYGLALPTRAIWRVACGQRKHFVGIGFVFLPVSLQFHSFVSLHLLLIPRCSRYVVVFCVNDVELDPLAPLPSSSWGLLLSFRIAHIHAAPLISRILMVIARCGRVCWDLSNQAARAARANFVPFLFVCSLIKILNPRFCGSSSCPAALILLSRATLEILTSKTTFSVMCRISSFKSNGPGTQAVCSKAGLFDPSAWCGAFSWA